MTLKLSVSGVRGIIDKSLTPSICEDLAKAFALLVGDGPIIIGTDTRPSRTIIKQAVISGLKFSGCTTFDAGIIPTPTASILIRQLKAKGAIVITASHNPKEWNGLKFFNEKGMFLNQEAIEELFKLWKKGEFPSRPDGIPRHLEEPFGPHLSEIFKHVDVAKIGSKEFKVAIDCVNGAGSIITQKLLRDLGCSVVSINTNPDLEFPRDPEPTPENLKDLCNLVKKEKADIGFAQDPDADRLAIVSNKGIAIGEENTLALAVAHVLKHKQLTPRSSQPIAIVNLSTTKAIDDIAESFGVRVIRTKIGEINVAEQMIKQKATIGGEGNGGVIYPPLSFNRDSLIGIALILEYMAKSGKKISELADELPQYYMLKKKISCNSREEVKAVIEKTKSLFKDQKLDFTDGVKVIFKDSWIHVRPSNTEPIIRIIAEAKTKKQAEDLANKL